MEAQQRVEYFNFETLKQIDPLYFTPSNKVAENFERKRAMNKKLNKKPISKVKRTCNRCLGYIRGECKFGFQQNSGVPIEPCPKPIYNTHVVLIDEWKLNNLKQN